MTLPLYMLRRLAMPGGVRLKRLEPPVEVVGLCPVCTKAVVKTKVVGIMSPEGLFYHNEWYHYQCRSKADDSTDGRPYRKEKQKSPPGNLDNAEYRYWIGVSLGAGSQFAMCRCCRTSTYGALGRGEHQKDPKFRVDGDQCTTRLVRAYNNLIKTDVCIVCKKHRWGEEKWGVPLCGDVACETEWKFNQTSKYFRLEAELHLQEKKAEFKAREVLKNEYAKQGYAIQAMTNMATGEVIERPWCNMCRMLADVPAHEEQHAKNLLKSGLAC